MKAYSYIRFSTPEQEKGNSLYADVLPEENGKLANMIRRDEP
jgi:hypothetical protein